MNMTSVQAGTSVLPRDLARMRDTGVACDVIDVRTRPEHEDARIDGVPLVPLDELDPGAFLGARSRPGARLYVLCQSGARAAKAAEKFKKAGFDGCVVVEGGLQAWMDAGLPVARGQRRVLPLMRQVQVVVGAVSAAGSVLALAVHPYFALVPLMMGAGLLFAGLTGTCGLAILLARMPWNRGTGRASSCAL